VGQEYNEKVLPIHTPSSLHGALKRTSNTSFSPPLLVWYKMELLVEANLFC